MPEPSSPSPELPERFARVAALHGPAGLLRLRSARAAVIGLGGVGSHAAIALAATGIGALLLVDGDRVTAPTLNRLWVAGPADLGRFKVDVLAEHLARTCPQTRVETRPLFFEPAGTLLAPPLDFLLDAIDHPTAKVELLALAAAAGLPAASAMGASSRRDPTRISVDRLGATRACPLARRVRQALRARLGTLPDTLFCVYSTEPAGKREPGPLPSQIIGPGIFGYALAALAVEWIAGGAPEWAGRSQIS